MAAEPNANPRRPARPVLTASVLAFEAIIVLLAIPMAIVVGGYPAAAGWALAGLAVVCALLPGMARRSWFELAGWTVQVALLSVGLLVPMMLPLALVFTALWFTAIRLQSKTGRAPAGG